MSAKANNDIFGSVVDRGLSAARCRPVAAVCRLVAVAFCLVCCAGAMAGEKAPAPLVRVTGNGMAWSGGLSLGVTDFMPWAEFLEAEDPNFPEDGRQIFKGIKLSRVLKLAGLGNSHNLTVIGSDQYVGYLTPEQAGRGLLVWEAGGSSVSGFRGGPFKLMFPKGAGVHASCYTWYVAALIQGSPQVPELAVRSGKNTRGFAVQDLDARAKVLPPQMVSIAQGCRNIFPEINLDQPARSVSLAGLTGDLSRARAVELIPYYGAVLRLKPEALAFDARVIIGYGGRDMHPSLGGPFAVVFPVEAHPELKVLVPESGAFFFLKAVVVR